MIFFINTSLNPGPMRRYLRSPWGRHFAAKIYPLTYEQFLNRKEYPPSIYIFGDLELLDDALRKDVIAVYQKLKAQPQTLCLNDPEKTLLRCELLKELSRNGTNAYAVYRSTDDLSGIRFPVFLRNANDHLGPRTGLIHNHASLWSSLAKLSEEAPQTDPRDWLICEFCDTADENGIYRKYSSFIVDGTIIPRHIFFSRRWDVKDKDLLQKFFVQEELKYLQNNPHQEALSSIFRLASVDYGRIDYAMLDGKIQVWEINTNPILLTTEIMFKMPERADIHNNFAKEMETTLDELDQRFPLPPGKRLRYTLDARWQNSGINRKWRQSKIALAQQCPWLLKTYQKLKKPSRPSLP